MKSKKELKAAYKQMKFPMGVFQIRNTTNGKIFIASSNNINALWNRHRTELKFNSHKNKILQKDWNDFGEGTFVFEVLGEVPYDEETVNYQEEIKTLEALYLEELKPFGEKGYN